MAASLFASLSSDVNATIGDSSHVVSSMNVFSPLTPTDIGVAVSTIVAETCITIASCSQSTALTILMSSP